MLTERQLYGSASYEVFDVRCRCGRGGWGREEVVGRTELVLPRRGVFLRRSAGRVTLAEPSGFLWFHGDEPYQIRHPLDGGDRCTVVRIGSEVVDETALALGRLSSEGGDGPEGSSHTVSGSRLSRLHWRLLELVSGHEHSSLAIEETCAWLVQRAAETLGAEPARGDGRRRSTAKAHRQLVEDARIELMRRLDTNATLGEISRKIGSSQYHLCRVFRRETGMTLSEYRALLRTRLAQDRLSQGEDDLTRLALDLGFWDHAHFCRVFKLHTGFAPSEWRERHGASS